MQVVESTRAPGGQRLPALRTPLAESRIFVYFQILKTDDPKTGVSRKKGPTSKFLHKGLTTLLRHWFLEAGASILMRPWCISPLFQISLPPIFLVVDHKFWMSSLFSLFQYISRLFRENYYFPSTLKNVPPVLGKFTCFLYTSCVFRFPPTLTMMH